MSKLLKAAIVCSAAFACSASWSGTASTTFQVTATVVSACKVTGTDLNFGNNIDPLAASVPLDSTSTLTVTCSNTTPYTIALDAGIHAGGVTNFTGRSMKNGSNLLGYQLYTTNARNTVWGNGTSSSTLGGTGTGLEQTLSIYGRLPTLSGAIPGHYTDTVTVTITY